MVRINLREVRCKNCGGTVQYSPKTVILVCNYCGSHFEIEDPIEKEVEKPDSIIPFSITKEEYHKLFLEWFIQGDYTPNDILTCFDWQNVTGIYLPFYSFSIKYNIDWSAKSGNFYTGYKNRREVEWDPSGGRVSGKFCDKGIATDFLDHRFADFCEKTEFRENKLKPFKLEYTLGFSIEPFKCSTENVFENRLKYDLNKRVRLKTVSDIPGDTYKDLKFSYDTENIKDPEKVYMPFWITSYKYKDKIYKCIIDGQDSKRIKGDKPSDNFRKWKVRFGCLPLLLSIIIFFIIVLSPEILDKYEDTITNVGFWAIFTSFILGIFARVIIIYIAKKRRKKILEKFM